MNHAKSLNNAHFNRWPPKRKATIVFDILKHKTTVPKVCRQHHPMPAEVEAWIQEAQGDMENALRARPRDVQEQYEAPIKELQANVGELMLPNDAPKKSSTQTR